jgi:hypothetical protein
MNLYPASGNIRYSRTVTVTPELASLIRQGDAVIVVHGIDYDNNHVYDFRALGVSDLDKTLPGEATAPALCGPLVAFPQASAATGQDRPGSASTTYAASLVPDVAPRRQLRSVALLCHIGQNEPFATRLKIRSAV